MNDWKEYFLSDITDIIGGGTPKRSEPRYWNGTIPWLSVKDFNNSNRYVSSSEESITEEGLKNSSTKILLPGQLIISARGTVGELAQLKKEMAFNQSCYGLSGRDNLVINDFLYYLVKHSLTNIQKITHGAVFDTITKNTFEHIKVKIPSIPVQRKIANILGSLDDKIELSRQMNQSLESMARAIFKSWFVDFDPVYAKMEGRDYPLPPEIMDLFPDELEESELGMIPKGWRVSNIDEVIEFNPNYSLRKGDFASYLEMKNLSETSYYPSNWIKRKFLSGTKFSNGDTLLARITPCLENGKTAYINFLEEKEVAWGSTEYIVMRSIPPTPKPFSYFLARNNLFREFAIKSMTGSSGRQRVQLDTLEKFNLILPENNEILIFWNSIIEPIFQKIKNNYEQSRTLQRIRDLLMPKLLTGKIKV